MKKLFLSVIAVLTIVSFGFLQPKEQPVQSQETLKFTTVGSAEKFSEIVEEINHKQNALMKSQQGFFRGGFGSGAKMAKEESAVMDSGVGGDHSSTNVQVEGVDEADRIKNDGKYIYQLIDDQFIISKVAPVSEMEIVYKEQFTFNEFYPQEMYVDDKHLVLIGTRPGYDEKEKIHRDFTKVKVYQLKDRSNLTLVREVEVEGFYTSSRKIKDALYLITNKHVPYYLLNETYAKEEKVKLLEEIKPMYRDSAIKDDTQTIGWDKIYYFPGSAEGSYLIVSGLDLSDVTKPLDVQSYLGAGQTIYANHEHLYVTRPDYQFQETNTMEKMASIVFPRVINQDTIVYKWKLENAKVTFLAEGKVEGALLNQFSMDEHDKHFRIATTKGDMWSEENQSENLLFILNEELNEVGSIKGIAPGERIYSARFIGERGYIVTFKQVDPLFVLDLKDPTNPKILGELKIPGFSDYLHPYDENHIIGFGKDTMETSQGGAIVRGFKMALFDITDVTNPKEKFVEIIGDSGTHSELLYNHKALLFSKEKNLISFPIDVYENKGGSYPQFAFQGAYVYGLDLTNGFELKKRISHYEKEITEQNWEYENHVTRIMYIDDSLYSISNAKIEAHDLHQFQKQGELKIRK